MGSPSVQNCASLADQIWHTSVMCDGAVESDGNWSAEVRDGVGKGSGRDICASRNCKHGPPMFGLFIHHGSSRSCP